MSALLAIKMVSMKKLLDANNLPKKVGESVKTPRANLFPLDNSMLSHELPRCSSLFSQNKVGANV